MNVSQGPGNLVFMAVLFIIFAVSIYYLYKWLNGANNDMKDLAVYTTSTGLIAMSSTTTTVSDSMPQLYGGGEFSISTWIYITNWGINKGKGSIPFPIPNSQIPIPLFSIPYVSPLIHTK